MTLRAWLFLAGFVVAPSAEAAYVDHEADAFVPNFETSGDWMGAGAGFVDYDGDGWEDVAFVHATSGIFLYRNEGPPDFEFTDVTAGSGLEGDFENAAGFGVADYDRDGDPDLFMPERRGCRLYRNDGGGAFTDVTADALTGLPWESFSIAFADVDGDGWIDAYVGSATLYVDYPFHECLPDVLLHNRRDGTFESVASEWGIDERGCTLSVLGSDYDRDGDPDLLASNDLGQFVSPNALYRNDGLQSDGRVSFTDVSLSSGFDQRLYGMGIGTADLDENGRADYFSTSFGRDVLLLGQEDGTFLDATEDYGVMSIFPDDGWRVTWAAAFVDVEMDGVFDLAVASGYTPASPQTDDSTNQPSLLYRNLSPGWAGNAATEEAEDLGCAPNDASRSLAVGDFDRDGDDDFATSAIGGFTHLYRNDAERGPVARLRLRGTVSNPDAFGTLVTLRCGDVVRTREKFSGGAYASAHGAELRVPLAGCDDGGTIEVRWPSGRRETVEVDASDVELDLVEPTFLSVLPDAIPADAVTEAVVRLEPTEGAGHVVTMTTTAGTLGPVVDLGDGAYEARLRAPASPSEAVLDIAVDGEASFAHPRVAFYAAGGDRTTLHLFPSAYVANETDVVATVVPCGPDGVPDGPGVDVALEVDRGRVQGDVEDLGDGRYRATIRGDGGGPLDVRARVGGALCASARLPEIAGLDPVRTRVFEEPGYLDALDVPISRVGIVVSPRDGLGNLVDLDREVVVRNAAGEEMTILDEGMRSGAFVRTVAAAELLDEGPATVEVDGVVLARTVELVTWNDPADLAAWVDPTRSRAAPFHQSAYADGADTDWIAVDLRDAEGDVIPAGDWVSYSSDAMTVLETDTVATSGQAFLRAGREPGEAWVDVEIGGAPTGVRAWIDLLPAREIDVSRLHVEVCAPGRALEIVGDAPVEVSIRPKWEDDDLVGSNVPLAATVDGADVPVAYDERGSYAARFPMPKVPGRRTIRAEIPGTDEAAEIWIDFWSGEPPADPPPPIRCVSSEPPGVEPDAGPPDAGSDADADGDADSDADASSHDAGTTTLARARGGGCACRTSRGDASSSIAALLAIGLLARRRFRGHAGPTRRGG